MWRNFAETIEMQEEKTLAIQPSLTREKVFILKFSDSFGSPNVSWEDDGWGGGGVSFTAWNPRILLVRPSCPEIRQK